MAGASSATGLKLKLRPSYLVGATVAGVATSVVGMAATVPESVSASQVDLAALVAVGSSTHPSGSGNEDYYGGMFNPPNTTVDHVNFFLGPWGIDRALRDSEDTNNVVLASGWGAANASLLLTYLNATDPTDNAVTKTVWVLDNNVSRPNGGFGTRYPIFALLGVNPIPTPTDTNAAAVVDVGYEYDINSDAPAYPLNFVADANSLVAYFYGHLNQDDVELPINPDGTPTCSASCTVDTASGRAHVTTVGNVTYVTYESDGLPLVKPLRDLGPAGVKIADVVEPALEVVVKYGYPNNDPLSDPSKYTTAGVTPGLQQRIEAARALPGAIQKGLATLGNDSPAPNATKRVVDDSTPPVSKRKPLVNDSPNFTLKPLGHGSSPGTRSGPISTAVKSAVDFHKQFRDAVSSVGKKPKAAHTAGGETP